MTPTSLRHRLVLLFVVVGAVVGLLTVLVVLALDSLDDAAHARVEQYGPAVTETAVLAKAYSDQESGLRGFQVAGREDFLEPYLTGRAAERVSLRRLQRMLADRADLLARLAEVRREARDWHAQVAAPAIERVRAQGPVPLSVADVAEANARFDRVRVALAELEAPVRAARERSGRRLTGSQDWLAGILGLALVGVALLGVLAWQLLRRWVTDPLHRLGGEVDRVEAGDMSRRVALDAAPAEIAVLAGQVERMRVRILHEYALGEQARLEALEARALVEEQAEDLRRSNAELEQFAYVASHDLQEPLRKVASFCQLIERRYKGQLDERGEQYIEFAVDGAKRMQQLINDLLAFSRVGRRTAEFETVALTEVFAQAQRQLASLIDEAGARVTSDSLPEVRGDASLLVQLLQNLIGNGVKFRSERAPHVHLGVCGTVDGFVELTCADNGIGIEPQYQDKIFVIFQRLHGRTAYEGTGIGLALCKKIVEFHGGRLWLDTAPRDTPGTTFHFTLPLARTRVTVPGRTTGQTGRQTG